MNRPSAIRKVVSCAGRAAACACLPIAPGPPLCLFACFGGSVRGLRPESVR
ncbi:hypothetical protein [Azospirillum argentinense]